MCTHSGCKHPNHSGADDCIFHLAKHKEQFDEFRKSIHDQIQNDKDCDFIGYNFPHGFQNFDEGTVLSNADFSDATIQSNIFFNKLIFEGVAIFHNIHFN